MRIDTYAHAGALGGLLDDLLGCEGVVEVCGEHECQFLDVLLERYVLLLCFNLNHGRLIF